MTQQAIGMVVVSGDEAVVKAAVEAGAAAAKLAGGTVISTHVDPAPTGDFRKPAEQGDSSNGEPSADQRSIEMAALAFGNPKPSESEPAIRHADTEVIELFYSPETMAIKREICSVGRKLWQRGYVDGNGGNISYRIGENAVICTPTLLSKADLQPEDLCLVDLEGTQLAGRLPRTSEVFLHLEIYKDVAQAKAVVHCHPPHATAYAVSGQEPPTAVIPEFDVFVGSVAVSQYETPGTRQFAETVRPFVQKHNTVLLGNHGVVCWADTPMHAEWYAENLETYCWTLLICRQLGFSYLQIPPAKQKDLLAIKKRLGLPDPRFTDKD